MLESLHADDPNAEATARISNRACRRPEVVAACAAAGVGRTTVYEWRDADRDFADAWDSAVESSVDLLEDEARRRAMAQSDLLLIFLLRHRRPSVYRPPPRATIAAIDPVMLADHKRAEEIRNMSSEELERELADINEKREAFERLRHSRGNGAASQ